jgi:hypothetical protein
VQHYHQIRSLLLSGNLQPLLLCCTGNGMRYGGFLIYSGEKLVGEFSLYRKALCVVIEARELV